MLMKAAVSAVVSFADRLILLLLLYSLYVSEQN